MYEKVTSYIDAISALDESELIPIVHKIRKSQSRNPFHAQEGVNYEYNPLLWECLNTWSIDHFVNTVADQTKGVRPEVFSSDEWLDGLDEDRANLTLSWLCTNEEYYKGTLAEWVRNGTLLRILETLRKVDEGSDEG